MVSHGEDEEDYVTGFFTTRRVCASDQESAERMVLEELRREWRDHGPKLSVVDVWKTGRFEFRRVPNRGHTFFSDDYSRYASAWLEAKVSRAPESTAIRKLAALHVEDEDE